MRFRALGLLLILLCVAAGSASAAPRTGPTGDAFYTPPKPLPGSGHGSLIWRRAISDAAAVPSARRNDRVLYRSTGVTGRAVAASGTVSVPRGRVPRGGWPVVTYAHGTTGIADQCAPSRVPETGVVNAYSTYIYPLLERWLKKGYAVVRADYEGLGTPGTHPYLIGRSEGRSTLDIVRAARSLDKRLGRRVIVAGHSQGGHAALFAASLARTWTPDLDVRGTVAFAPASHLQEQVPVIRSVEQPLGGVTGLVAMMLRGLDAADPDLRIANLLGDRARELYPQTLTECLAELGSQESFGGLPANQLVRQDANFAPVVRGLRANDPARLKIRTPVLIEQGSADTTVLPVYSERTAKELRQRGARVEYDVREGAGHAELPLVTAAAATSWIAKRLR